VIHYSEAIDYTKPVYWENNWYLISDHHPDKEYVYIESINNGIFPKDQLRQLYRTCEACEGDGCISQQPQNAPPKAEMVNAVAPIKCISCNGTGQIHLDRDLETLERLSELMKVEKPELNEKGLRTDVSEWVGYNAAQQEIKKILEL